MPPLEKTIRQHHDGRYPLIRFATTASPLGQVLLAATEKGVCWLNFATASVALEMTLQRAFPCATLVPAGKKLQPWLEQIQQYLNGEQFHIDLPLDVRATTFQRRVWDALCAIPYGQTRSYRQLAEAIDAPRAVRAVARACAINPVMVIVPCHRVIGSDGQLRGYAGGLLRKKRLLDMEQKLKDFAAKA